MNDRLSTIVYPDKTDEHMIVIKKKKPIVFDENYPFINRNILFRIFARIMWALQITVGRLVLFVIIGARIKGRQNLKRNKELLKRGAVSVCNHVHFYDAIMVAGALMHYSYHPSWDQNCQGPNRLLIRSTGGIPVPSNNMRGLRAMNQAFDTLLSEGKWLHIFPEGSMWWYYRPIRPFKKAAFGFAVRHNVPVIPLAFSYRSPTGLYKLFGRKDPLLTLNVGAPILPPDPSEGSDNERIEKLRVAAETACANIAGTVRYVDLTEEEIVAMRGGATRASQ